MAGHFVIMDGLSTSKLREIRHLFRDENVVLSQVFHARGTQQGNHVFPGWQRGDEQRLSKALELNTLPDNEINWPFARRQNVPPHQNIEIISNRDTQAQAVHLSLNIACKPCLFLQQINHDAIDRLNNPVQALGIQPIVQAFDIQLKRGNVSIEFYYMDGMRVGA